MKILIRKVNILSPDSPYSGMCKDVVLSDGIIQSIQDADTVKSGFDERIDGENKILSSGWTDLHANFREPGQEHKENLSSGCHAASQGGFTKVLLMPSTVPPLDNRSAVEFIINRTKNELTEVMPSGTLSFHQEGKDLSEMFDMFEAGAKVFTDEKKSIADAGLMLRALLYVKNFNGIIFSYPNDKSISGKGQMNEGRVSTSLGLKGLPGIAEEVMIHRDLALAEYADCRIHFATISTGKSVELIREAKRKGMKVTADVSVNNLALTDAELLTFDTSFKVDPPLRTLEDVNMIIGGLKDGTIDAICSDHQPEDTENKIKEFELAAFGAEGLETCFAAAYTALKDHMNLENIIDKFTTGPGRILEQRPSVIKENQPADLTLFDVEHNWTVSMNDIFSKSKNNPFLNRTLQGKAVAVFNKGRFFICK